MIDTDTRQLKRDPDGLYRTGAGKIPCDHCGHTATCPRVPGKVVTRCGDFLPALPFQDEAGLDRPSNTVRIGVAWNQRLIVGQAVALYNARTRAIFGHSEVTNLVAGPIDEILAAHARNNHLMLDVDPALAAAELKAWQLRNYGPRIVHDGTKLTAIYLRPLGEDDVPTD